MTELPGLGSVLCPPSSDNRPPEQYEISQLCEQELVALQWFKETTHTSDRTIEHPVRVCKILSDFTGGQLAPEVYSAALLHDVGQAAASNDIVYGKNGARALKYAYQGRDRELSWEYVSTLLSDLNQIEEYSELHRSREGAKSKALQAILAKKDTAKDPLPSELWLEPPALTLPTTMKQLLDGVNVESVLIKAAEMLDNLTLPSEDERAILRDVHDAESFYAPICEIMGKDGLGSALRSQANVLRLRKAGLGSFVDQAEEIIASLPPREQIPQAVAQLLGGLAIGYDHDTDYAIRDTIGHGIQLGIAEIALVDKAGANKNIRAVWRVKSVGSLAMKLMRIHHESMRANASTDGASPTLTPADIIGVNIITPDIDTLTDVYTRAAISASGSNEIELVSSPSREQTLNVRGPSSFVDRVIGAVLRSDANNVTSAGHVFELGDIDYADKTKEGDDIRFAVAKLTCMAQGLGIEVQFQTEKDRIESRIGLASHILYELGEKIKKRTGTHEEVTITPDELTAMSEINMRMKALSADFEVIPASRDRGQALRKTVARTHFQDAFWWRRRAKQ